MKEDMGFVNGGWFDKVNSWSLGFLNIIQLHNEFKKGL
jgi:hypothetical protein